mgnify:FL=1
MSEYMFGVTRENLSKREANRRDKIARQFGCTFTTYSAPGNDVTGWYAGPNRGFPFDGQMEKAVLDSVNGK